MYCIDFFIFVSSLILMKFVILEMMKNMNMSMCLSRD